jgi:hypothetical protein
MFLTKLCLLGGLALSIAAAQSLTIVNPDFSAVAVQCSGGYAYQSYMGKTCAGPPAPEQDFNAAPGIGWTFLPAGPNSIGEDGITAANTAFNPPPFTGLPFTYAAFLQGPGSIISQKIDGFLPGRYRLSFYLGSRYASGISGGNETVLVTVDNRLIGVWPLASRTPFTLRTAIVNVATSGSHILTFRGASAGAETAFFSGVSIAAAQ